MCPSCCPTCRAVLVGDACIIDSIGDPYSLHNLFPAGTVSVQLSSTEIPCSHTHELDKWHAYDGHDSLQDCLVTLEDHALLRQLDFLVNHRFFFITCRLSESNPKLYFRVYVVPFDLPNVQGRLRTRDEVAVMSPARKHLRAAFQRISQDSAAWNGCEGSEGIRPFMYPEVDNRTMAEIYSDLPSPVISCNDESRHEDITPRILSDDISGMRSRLYPYQRRSVVAMLQNEVCQNSIPDPCYIPLLAMDGRTLFLQPAKMEILRERPTVARTRGGVLCEELGTGKTVMILGLVLSTLDQLSKPEESILEDLPVMTPLALLIFPFSEHAAARKRATRGKYKEKSVTPFPTLMEFMIHHIRTRPEQLNLHQYEDRLESCSLWGMVTLNAPFYHHYCFDPLEGQRSRRKPTDFGPRVVYLTSATLIVVPPNLLAQWDSEIQKHCDSTLRVLIVRAQTDLPRARIMANNYDIVLMSHLRFSAEASRSDVSKLYQWGLCKCPMYRRTRLPDCVCDRLHEDTVSPLVRIRWKRLVIDEGHNCATTSTNLTPFAKLLSVERRWIVTGTPTTNLLGLSFGSVDDVTAIDKLTMTDCDSDSAMSFDTAESEDNRSARQWTRYDRDDLRKLGTMMIDFLGVPLFAADRKMFDANVIAPLLDTQGPRYGAIQVLTQVMKMVMIRHRIQDVEKSITLPPVTHETVLLDLDSFAVKSYNALQAVIAINAIDSERVDQDYLFHPRNVSRLLQLMENMSQTLFWHTDSNLFNVDENMSRSDSLLENAVKRNVSPRDFELLQQALNHVRIAAKDESWRGMQAREDVLFRARNIPHKIVREWARFGTPSHLSDTDRGFHFMHPDRLLKMRDMVAQQPLAPLERIAAWGKLVRHEDEISHLLLQQKTLLRKRRRTDTSHHHEKTHVSAPKEKAQEVRNDLKGALEELHEMGVNGTPIPSTSLPSDLMSNVRSQPSYNKLIFSSILANVHIGSSTSSKLNYILQEILRYSADEKFLVFSNSPLTLSHVSEGLDILRIKYLKFTTGIHHKVREQVVTTFETSDMFRVFLMELKHGARGLNLITASRVIFCEPVWQADVESQAIKRAHRIGQTRPITVKTLAIRSTAEEAMMARRGALKTKTGKLPSLTDEVGMRHFIQNPQFLVSSASASTEILDIPLIDNPFKRHGIDKAAITVHVARDPPAQPDEDAIVIPPPEKKRKGVRFAEEP